jgi:hypothetical protein
VIPPVQRAIAWRDYGKRRPTPMGTHEEKAAWLEAVVWLLERLR